MERNSEMARIGQRLRAARKRQGLTLEQVGLLTGHARPHIWKIENGLLPGLPVLTLRKVARALKIPLATLLGEKAA